MSEVRGDSRSAWGYETRGERRETRAGRAIGRFAYTDEQDRGSDSGKGERGGEGEDQDDGRRVRGESGSEYERVIRRRKDRGRVRTGDSDQSTRSGRAIARGGNQAEKTLSEGFKEGRRQFGRAINAYASTSLYPLASELRGPESCAYGSARRQTDNLDTVIKD
ncbi:hypothetical protein DFH09DRAFT_1097761 [Mycena vulgaris]|nr:hypothetical protein DFH09DRAFT_1097761 [Mycena vulgaris]